MTDYDDQNSSEYKDQTTETAPAEQTGQQISSPADGQDTNQQSPDNRQMSPQNNGTGSLLAEPKQPADPSSEQRTESLLAEPKQPAGSSSEQRAESLLAESNQPADASSA